MRAADVFCKRCQQISGAEGRQHACKAEDAELRICHAFGADVDLHAKPHKPNLLKYAGVQAFLSGVRPCVVALILATALTMGLSTLFGFTTIRSAPEVDLRGVVILLLLITLHFGYKHFKKKAPSPILMIVLSAGLGILFYAF